MSDDKRDLVPRDKGELEVPNTAHAIEAKKNEAILPLFTVMSEDILRRFTSGEMAADVKDMKLTTLINNLTKLIAAINKSAIVIVNPGAGEKKDPTFLRANSAANLTEKEKKARREAVDAEIVDPKEPS
jgi:hypothetical protein